MAAEMSPGNAELKDAEATLRFVYPALLVLKSMCRRAGLDGGAQKALEMHLEIEAYFAKTGRKAWLGNEIKSSRETGADG